MLRHLDVRVWRDVATYVLLPDGRKFFALGCGHERVDPPIEDVHLLNKQVRCVSCVPGVDAVVAVERRSR